MISQKIFKVKHFQVEIIFIHGMDKHLLVIIFSRLIPECDGKEMNFKSSSTSWWRQIVMNCYIYILLVVYVTM